MTKNGFKISVALLSSFLLFQTAKAQQPLDDPTAKKVLLPNGWSLTPAGRSLPLGDLPLNIQLSPDKHLLAVTNNGQGVQTLQLIDPVHEKILDEREIGKAWYGLKFSSDGKKLYASGGNDNIILVYPVIHNKLGNPDTITLGKPWPKEKICPAGIDVDDTSHKLYTVTKNNNSLYIIDLRNNVIIKKIPLRAEAYSCLLSPDKNKLYISLWGGKAVAVFDTKAEKMIAYIKTQGHPNELTITKDGRYLFAANANDNSVSVIDTKINEVIETISATIHPTSLIGSTTNALALSDDEKTIYVGNADNNCLAVFDVSDPGESRAKGFIPVGWYPTSIKVVNDKILVANGKGYSSLPNPGGPQPVSKLDNSGYKQGITNRKVQYIGSLFKGTLSIIDKPDKNQMMIYSQQVYANTPFDPGKEIPDQWKATNPVPHKKDMKSPIKYVFYIIKENRTYDQILGDVPTGNGDSTLCLFGRKVTPNEHALAKQFVLLDNFYVDGEVSADGHNWCDAAYATDFVEKTWPTHYGRRGGNGESSTTINYPGSGYIWDYCKRAGISYRTYGENLYRDKDGNNALKGHICKAYPRFNLRIKDVQRFQIWKHDFDSLLAIHKVPRLNTIQLPSDHTSGQRIGAFTPTASIADNDYAVGKFVEYISHSPIWMQSAIFILEDDAQNGPDHVDAHRSPAFVISPYVKRNFVCHQMYSTSGMVRTIELILGLPPMSQYDAAADPMWQCFMPKPDTSRYVAKEPKVNIYARNKKQNKSAIRSAAFDFSKPDAAPDELLNKIIWKSVKGEDAKMPAPRRSAFLNITDNEENE